MSGLAVKRCPNCDREVFSACRGDIMVKAPARVERIEAGGSVVAICACKRRVVWFRDKKRGRASISTG